jgi:integrase
MRADGKRYRIHAYGKTKKEALEKLRELQQQPRAMRGDAVTVTGYIEIWLADKARSVAHSTHYRYTTVSEHVKKYLGHHRVKDVGPAHIRDWYSQMAEDKVSASNQAKAAQLLGMVFKSAMADQICLGNPVAVVSRPQVPKTEFTILTPEQIKQFLAAADKNRMFGLFNLALATGARLGELLALEWRDIDFEARTMSIRRTLSEVGGHVTIKEPKTARGRRTIDLPQFAIEALHEQRKNNVIEGLASCELVFPTKRGTHMRQTNIHDRYFKPALRDAGLPAIRFHDLRHSAATWLLSLGMTPQDVATTLGHANVAFTIATYTHSLKSSRSAAIAKMDEALGGN